MPSLVGGSLHGPSHVTVARHACAPVSLPHASWARSAFACFRPIPVPLDTTLDQALVHWHDSLLVVRVANVREQGLVTLLVLQWPLCSRLPGFGSGSCTQLSNVWEDMKQRTSIGSCRLSGAAAGCRSSARCCECAQCRDQRQASFDSSRASLRAVMMLVDDESDGHASEHTV